MYDLKCFLFYNLEHLNESKTSSFFNKINKFERRTQIATKFINVQ